MTKLKGNKAIIIFGQAGSGKSTQADFIKKEIPNTIHFNSGEEIRKIIGNPLKLKDKKVAEIKKSYDKGEIVDPIWTLNTLVAPATIKYAKQGKNVVYSGSFRSMLETFNGKNHRGLIETTEEAFGKDNIIVFYIKLPVSESVKRNALRGREGGQDEAEMVKLRCKKFKETTYPVIVALKKRGIKVATIDGKPDRKIVFKNILKELKSFGLKPKTK